MKLVGKSRKRKKTKRIIITCVVLLLVIITGLTGLFIGVSYHADSLDTVFPNVWAEGINLSGQTREQAVQSLIDSGYESKAVGISMTLFFPDETSFSATGDEVGLALDATQAAEAAFAFGRDGTFFQNGVTYIKALFDKTELNELSAPNYDDSILRELANEYTAMFNATLFNYSENVTDTQITVTKGTGLYPANANDVFNMAVHTMTRAIEQHTNLTARYIPEANADGVDLQSIFDGIHIEPVSSMYDAQLGGGTESKPGRTFDLDDAKAKVAAAEFGATVSIPIITIEPELSQEDVNAMLFRDVLAERSASQGSQPGRVHNITLASSFINGKILQPGETFSYNDTVGRRTSARGFREANGIVGGRLVPTIGGGVCQVSSTIYAALLLTDLEIVSRRNHSLTVGYLPYGQDATVATDLIDFRFKNSSDFPIRLDVTTSGGVTVNVKVIGTRVNDIFYELETRTISQTPVQIVEKDSPDVNPGERIVDLPGQVGRVIETWQWQITKDGEPILDDDGNRIGHRVSRDTYNMQQRVILIGPPLAETPTPPPTAPPTAPPTTEPTPTPTPTPTAPPETAPPTAEPEP
ncbi:MAG: VanW family protein [Oscillospiraceae bacterium]|nr:VanW family protein [Oscillospiraceae bacterium]